MRRVAPILILLGVLLAACGAVNLDAPVPVYETGVDPAAWAPVPAGEFLAGQHDDPVALTYTYEIMVTDVTAAQYAGFLNAALAYGSATIAEGAVTGAYPGDPYAGAKHEMRIDAGDYRLTTLGDPASRLVFDGKAFSVKSGWESHPMTNVTWFGALAYCGFHGWRLPTEMEWEKAARGTDGRAYPWGNELTRDRANYYRSRDPFEEMSTLGSRTSPAGFYSGQSYDGHATLDGASPYGLYDMAGNVWQWVGDVLPGFSDRFLRGGSKDSYAGDLRAWVRNSAPPTYYGPGVGFRCARRE